MKEFQQRLKKERKLAGYTQAEMAVILGIPFTTYRNYETLSGASREPDLEMLKKIADALNVTSDYLIGRD